ncbi:FecR family protein [Pedobacter steynii]|uniref:FecR family protein n=1 Tax=Pedobacter steynii TaxID=430522 RepID=UPI001FE0DE96|nr:FecR family protein [Pedobacter steynii]
MADLIAAYHEGKLNVRQKAELEAKLIGDASFKRMFDSFNNKTNVFSDLKVMNGFDTELSLVEFHKRYATPKTFRLWPRIAAATAALVAIAFCIWFYTSPDPDHTPELVSVSEDIAPGKQGATLTLANGKKIRLSDAANGQIAKETGISVTKTADGQLVYEVKETNDNLNQINTLSTAKGETYILTLPDKSKVWLNAASSLTYSAGLMERGHSARLVKLEGEAYFEVAKDKTHPFVVESKGQRVEVLGTHFNVNAYADEPIIATTLLEGSVKVTDGINKQIIKPGEQALNNSGKIKVEEVNIESITDWKNGELYLNHINFKVAMRKIARWYDVEIIYNASVPDDMEIGGWVSRNEKLSSVLKSIESAGLVKFKIEGKKIYINK